MQTKQFKVIFESQGRMSSVLPGSALLEAAAKAGLIIEAHCGGAGTCAKCRVQITAGAAPPTAAEQAAFTSPELQAGWRLACQTLVQQDMKLQVPASALLTDQMQILAATSSRKIELIPAIRKFFVQMPAPSPDDARADCLRLREALGPFQMDLELLRQLPARLRAENFTGTAVLAAQHLIAFEAGDTSKQLYGAAFDIGTTTLVGTLLDLRTGAEKALVARPNPQIQYGDDVLSRIRHATLQPEGLADLRRVLLEALTDMLSHLCDQAAVTCQQIYEVVLAGNTAMQQILCGIDSRFLGELPFAPVQAAGLAGAAQQMGLSIAPGGRAYVLPIIGGFVGGDTVASMLASRILERETPLLLVDLGTNGEIVLAHDGRLWCASTAAGPVFEGARLSCGMRAEPGAIEKVVLNDDLHLEVIGQLPPKGICGSGLIDLIAALLNHGILTPAGQLLAPDALPARLPVALAQRVRLNRSGAPEFLVCQREREPLLLTQRDIREVQLGAGAIRAGITLLLKQARINPRAIRAVLLSGGFGNFIRHQHAQRIGLLPPDIEHKRITSLGNAALSGAKWVLLNTAARHQAELIARQPRHVELSQAADFQAQFAEAMIFPESGS